TFAAPERARLERRERLRLAGERCLQYLLALGELLEALGGGLARAVQLEALELASQTLARIRDAQLEQRALRGDVVVEHRDHQRYQGEALHHGSGREHLRLLAEDRAVEIDLLAHSAFFSTRNPAPIS